jgi:hypothetical protein
VDLGSADTVKLPVEEREGGGEEGGGGGSDEKEEGPPSGSRRGRHEADVRFRMAWDTDVCRLHDSRPQARPMKELSSAFCRLAANRRTCLRTDSPSELIAPVTSNTKGQKE